MCIQLSNPVNLVDGRRVHGKFRITDVRWTKNIGIVTQIYLNPGAIPMYQIDGNDNVSYSKAQLQIVKTDEVQPTEDTLRKFVIEKLIRKFKKKINFILK